MNIVDVSHLTFQVIFCVATGQCYNIMSLSFQFTPTLFGSTERAATPMVCSVPASESTATVSSLTTCMLRWYLQGS